MLITARDDAEAITANDGKLSFYLTVTNLANNAVEVRMGIVVGLRYGKGELTCGCLDMS